MVNDIIIGDNFNEWAFTVGVMLSFIGFIIACICSCRRNDTSEFLGLAGMVTIAHPDSEVYNGLPSNETSRIITRDTTDGGKRASTANRSLPDIPMDEITEPDEEEDKPQPIPQDSLYEKNEKSGEVHELYATVKEIDQTTDRDQLNTCDQNSQDDTINPYTSVTTYATEEHPYAHVHVVPTSEVQVHRGSNGQSVNNNEPSTSSSLHGGNPIAPPRTRRSSSQNSLLSTEPLPDIHAANAISGGVQANQDLPYMTPPILMPLPHLPQSQHNSHQSQHFSGDSQDSKGYTSISVREPLANIMAQSKSAHQERQIRPLTDPHYATVSDDSDEMYAAIDEQDKIYTSGSETYAQIQPMASDTSRNVTSEQNCAQSSQDHTSAPQPPSVDSLRHVAHAHSRQDDISFAASSSSATSSIINPSSPKPEKRQANSPLPPPPEGISELYAEVDKRGKTDNRNRFSATAKSLEEMYAKVLKKKKDRDNDDSYHDINIHSGNIFNFDFSLKKSSADSKDSSSYELAEVHKSDIDRSQVNPHIKNWPNRNFDTISDGGSMSKMAIEHNYEAVKTKSKMPLQKSSSEDDPTYETLPLPSLKNTSLRNGNDSSALYSVPFKNRQASNASSDDSGYEKVKDKPKSDMDVDSEPNYESMPHDPSYASVCRPGDSDTDPNYESVVHHDPNYESVKYMAVDSRKDEPPYEQVINYKMGGYEKIKSKKDAKDPDYEKIDPNYSTVEEATTNGKTDEELYVQV